MKRDGRQERNKQMHKQIRKDRIEETEVDYNAKKHITETE
jgi:hypothetical protein